MLAHEFFWFIVGSDATDNGTAVQTVIDFEFQQLFHLRHTFALQHSADADVQLLEIVKTNDFLDRFGFVVGFFVGFFDGFQFVQLELDGLILNLLKQ